MYHNNQYKFTKDIEKKNEKEPKKKPKKSLSQLFEIPKRKSINSKKKI
jgi:hypothetical protein